MKLFVQNKVSPLPPPVRSVVAELGQSNMSGRDGDSPLPTIREGYGFYWDGSTMETLTSTRGSAIGGSHVTYFAQRLTSMTGIRPVMVQTSVSGTGLTPKASNPNWGATSTLRATTIAQVNSALAEVEQDRPLCALWCQGETDGVRLETPNYSIAEIKTAMQDVIDWWFSNYPESPFLISELGDRLTNPNPTDWGDIRTMQNEIVAENELVYMAYTGAKDFVANGEMSSEFHYAYTGLRKMGVAFANKLTEILQ